MSARISTIRCPICERQFDPQKSSAMPFCSNRCRQIDLGRWLNEAYCVPITNPSGEEDEAPEPAPEE